MYGIDTTHDICSDGILSVLLDHTCTSVTRMRDFFLYYEDGRVMRQKIMLYDERGRGGGSRKKLYCMASGALESDIKKFLRRAAKFFFIIISIDIVSQ